MSTHLKLSAHGGGDAVLVEFRLPHATGAEEVCLVGEFNDWSTTAQPMERDGDAFVTTVPLAPGRAYRFRYLLDGERWENDWEADAYVPNEYGGDDSVIDLTHVRLRAAANDGPTEPPPVPLREPATGRKSEAAEETMTRTLTRSRSASYGPLLVGYAAMGAALIAGARRFGPSPVPRPSVSDAVIIGFGTFKLSRLVAKDKVLQPVRAPFVERVEEGEGSEVNSVPGGTGLRRAVGELLTCPFCLSIWIATLFVAAFAVRPRALRLVTSGLVAVAVADASQYVYSALREKAS